MRHQKKNDYHEQLYKFKTNQVLHNETPNQWNKQKKPIKTSLEIKQSQHSRKTSNISQPQSIDNFKNIYEKKGIQSNISYTLVLDYYNKHPIFSGTIHQDWRRQLSQIETLYDEYDTKPTI